MASIKALQQQALALGLTLLNMLEITCRYGKNGAFNVLVTWVLPLLLAGCVRPCGAVQCGPRSGAGPMSTLLLLLRAFLVRR